MTEKDFKLKVTTLAERIGVLEKISCIQLRKMKNKIASCSDKGRLTFDISVLDYSEDKVNEIILHELLHLRYKNRGKIFKILLRHYLENFTDGLER